MYLCGVVHIVFTCNNMLHTSGVHALCNAPYKGIRRAHTLHVITCMHIMHNSDTQCYR